jgi:endonuclease YncB( thermonuclease family)
LIGSDKDAPAAVSISISHTSHAKIIAGRATVIDCDTLEIHGERIRILDIDAPESRQKCKALSGSEWKCRQWAANKLAEWIGQLTVTCETTRKDQYGRWLARCDVAGVSVANWLVGHGWAVPYRGRRNAQCPDLGRRVRHAVEWRKAH